MVKNTGYGPKPECVPVADERILTLGRVLIAAAEAAGYSTGELVCTCAALVAFAGLNGIEVVSEDSCPACRKRLP